MSNKIAFITTIFPASEQYLDDFFNSLIKQTIKTFDVLVVNDGIKEFDLYKKRFNKLNIIEFKSECSPAKNRENGICLAKDLLYKYLIFGDSDDYFSDNRIEETLKLVKTYNIVVNDLNIFSQLGTKENIFSKYYKNGVYGIDFILDKNIIGFSNLAIKADIIPDNIEFENELVAVDWFFATLLLLKNRTFYFTNTTNSYYRQHSANTIGICSDTNEEKIKFGIKTKLIHFKSLIKYTKQCNLAMQEKLFIKKWNEIQKLNTLIKDPVFFKNYQNVIKNNYDNIFSGWWSEILTLKQIKEYEK